MRLFVIVVIAAIVAVLLLAGVLASSCTIVTIGGDAPELIRGGTKSREICVGDCAPDAAASAASAASGVQR